MAEEDWLGLGTRGIVDTSVVTSYLRDVEPVAGPFEDWLRMNYARFSTVTVFERCGIIERPDELDNSDELDESESS